MDMYSFLREMADSWALLVLTLLFVGICFWAFRPGSRAVQNEAANLIFRNEQKPAVDGEARTPRATPRPGQ
jgi:cytochrome c oxidase cbb3-type subunit 4